MSLEAVGSLVAAIISALSLAGVTVSLLLQAKQARISQSEALRTRHFELFRLAYEHSDLGRVWSEQDPPFPTEWRKHTYTNQIMMYFRMSHAMGESTDWEIREHAARLFSTIVGREFWARAGPLYLTTSRSRAHRKFCQLVQEEFERAMLASRGRSGSVHTVRVAPDDGYRG